MVLTIILLILCLPLMLMLSLFTTANVVSIAVNVPVNGIDVTVEEVVELDLDKGETFSVEYLISPTEASNKDVRFFFTQVGDSKLAEFTVEENLLIPTSYGSATVTVETLDGGYRDSFEVVVRSKRVESIISTPVSNTVTVGESTEIVTEYFPEIVNDKSLTYRVKDGEGIVSVSNSGKITATGVGTAVIEVTSADNPDAKSEFTVTAVSSGVIDFVNDKSYLTAIDTPSGVISSVINPAITVESYAIEVLDKDGAHLSDDVISVSFDPATGRIDYSMVDRTFIGVAEIRITVTPVGGESVTKSCYVEQVSEISIGWIDDIDQLHPGQYSVSYLESAGKRIGIDLKPLGANVSYLITLTKDAGNSSYTDVTAGSSSVSVEFGTQFELKADNVYVCNGGYISVELESSSDGVYLVVKGTYEPTINEIINNSAVTYIKMFVIDENNGNVTELETISVVVY